MSTVQSVADPGELIANIPGILGFYPKDSLVLCCFIADGDHLNSLTLGPVIRIDLGDAGATATAELAAHRGELERMSDQLGVVGVIAVTVTDSAASTQAVAEHLADPKALPFATIAVITVENILTGETWRTVASHPLFDVADAGLIAEVLAAASMQDMWERTGELPEACREDIEARLNATNHDRVDDLELAAIYRAVDGFEMPEQIDEALVVLRTAAGAVAHETPSVEELTAGLKCLREVLLRDALIYLLIEADKPGMDYAEQLMRTARLGSPLRAEATVVFALTALAQGLSGFGTTAVKHACDIRPAATLPRTVARALDFGGIVGLLDAVVEGGRDTLTEMVLASYESREA